MDWSRVLFLPFDTIFVGLADLFGTRFLETRSCLHELSIALCLNSFSKHECRLSDFLLERIVSIKRLMARQFPPELDQKKAR